MNPADIAEVGGALGYPEYNMEPGEGGEGGVEQFILLLKYNHNKISFIKMKNFLKTNVLEVPRAKRESTIKN